MAPKKKRFGELLVEKKVITEDDLNRALSYISKNGGRVGDALVALEIISESQLLSALRYHFGIPAVELRRIRIRKDIIGLLPKDTALKHRAVPFKIKDKTLLVVMSNPMDINAIEDIEFASGYRIQPILSKESEIAKALDAYYLGIKPVKMDEQAVREDDGDDILDNIDIIPGAPMDNESDDAEDVPAENPVSDGYPEYAPPHTPSREEAMAAEEAHLDTAAVQEDSDSAETFFLRDVVLYPMADSEEPILSLDEVEIDYEAAIEERRYLGDLVEELEEIDDIMHTAVMKNRRILKRLIILLVKKGYLTTEEVQILASTEPDEESTH
jgi:hypothetical protein